MATESATLLEALRAVADDIAVKAENWTRFTTPAGSAAGSAYLDASDQLTALLERFEH
jgi:hypothetical protein